MERRRRRRPGPRHAPRPAPAPAPGSRHAHGDGLRPGRGADVAHRARPHAQGSGGTGASAVEGKSRLSPAVTDPLPSRCGGLGAGSSPHPCSLRRRASPSPARCLCQFLAPRGVLVAGRGGILPHAVSVFLGFDFGWNDCSKLWND